MKSIGIIGGMGPLATVDLFGKIVRMTDAGGDTEHIHIYIDNNTSIPDRTQAIVAGGTDPRREMIRSAVKLECMGADFLVMPCNTAHYFYDAVAGAVNIPVLNMLEETARAIVAQGISTVGLLATDGTIASGVYDKHLEAKGLTVLKPDPDGQRHVMDLIYKGVKAGNMDWDIGPFVGVLKALEQQGAEAVILGCTELPLAFQQYRINAPHIDPTTVLAQSAIRMAGKQVK